MIDRADPDYSTTAREITDITIVQEREHQPWGACRLSLGEVDVTHQVVSYLKRRQPGGEVLGEEPLDLPERTLRTTAVWWTVPDHVLAEAGLSARDVPGAAHAAEHCSIGLLPLFATCDRWDIGGVSTALHPDTGQLTVFVYDGHPGGAGFSERGFRAARDWLAATRDAIASCTCEEGCPSCIQSPKCGNQNNPLDKAGAVRPARPAARGGIDRGALESAHGPGSGAHPARRTRDRRRGLHRSTARAELLGVDVSGWRSTSSASAAASRSCGASASQVGHQAQPAPAPRVARSSTSSPRSSTSARPSVADDDKGDDATGD